MPEAPVCESCGMPMSAPEEFGGGDTANRYCTHCCNADGTLQTYEERLAGMTGFMMSTQGLSEEGAREAARAYMAEMPAWRDRA